MNCDVCSKTTNPKKGYILSTSQVVHDPGYWKRAFGLLPATAEAMERGLPDFVRRMSGSKSDWAVCEECMGYLQQDRAKAARYYSEYVRTGKRPRIPDSGPANVDLAAIKASGAFEAVYGRKPKSIKFPEASSQKVISSEELSQRMATIAASGDREEMGRLGSMQVKCKECGAVMPVMEAQMTASGMSCPRCDKPWFLIFRS